jgi:hypothetical protein
MPHHQDHQYFQLVHSKLDQMRLHLTLFLGQVALLRKVLLPWRCHQPTLDSHHPFQMLRRMIPPPQRLRHQRLRPQKYQEPHPKEQARFCVRMGKLVEESRTAGMAHLTRSLPDDEHAQEYVLSSLPILSQIILQRFSWFLTVSK